MNSSPRLQRAIEVRLLGVCSHRLRKTWAPELAGRATVGRQLRRLVDKITGRVNHVEYSSSGTTLARASSSERIPSASASSPRMRETFSSLSRGREVGVHVGHGSTCAAARAAHQRKTQVLNESGERQRRDGTGAHTDKQERNEQAKVSTTRAPFTSG